MKKKNSTSHIFVYFINFAFFACYLPLSGSRLDAPLYCSEPIIHHLTLEQSKTIPLGLPLYWWQQKDFVNFGDYLSLMLVERIVQQPVKTFKFWPPSTYQKMLALGSLLSFARENDVIWGTGMNGKLPNKESYSFTQLDVRAVRGPITRAFLEENFQIHCPEIYGDPALLLPYLFPEFKTNPQPHYPYIIIPHFSEEKLFPKELFPNVVYPTEPWNEVIEKILDSAFVISSSLHGIIVAEAYGIPARYLRISEKEYILKYIDYYSGTNRPDFKFARSVEEALEMGGEKPLECDLKKLYEAFPFEFWPNAIPSSAVFPDPNNQ